MDYTIVGGAVNTASRLEALAPPGEILISYETYAHVKQNILCEERGKIDVRGLAYPLATYQVINSYKALKNDRKGVHEDHPKLKFDLDLEGMTADDQKHAETVLRRALDLVSSVGNKPAKRRRGKR
jgi:hypothetical protein